MWDVLADGARRAFTPLQWLVVGAAVFVAVALCAYAYADYRLACAIAEAAEAECAEADEWINY